MMALPIDVLLADNSNQAQIYQKIIYCCTKMQNHIVDPANYGGLTIHLRSDANPKDYPHISLTNDPDPEPIDYCPFCASKIQVMPM